MKRSELSYLMKALRHKPLETAVETGTLVGETTEQLAKIFNCVYSIELSPVLHERAVKKFESMPWVKLIHDDSSVRVPVLATRISEPAFWYLDAHWYQCEIGHPIAHERAGNPFPLWDEIDAVASRPQDDLVFIDDIHCFGRKSSGPDAPWSTVTTKTIVERFGGRAEKTDLVNDVFVVYKNRA